jgi:hypothetical protein
VPQLCCPDAERLLSKKMAFPATAARERLLAFEVPGVSPLEEVPEPQADRAPTLISKARIIQRRSDHRRHIDLIRIVPTQVANTCFCYECEYYRE